MAIEERRGLDGLIADDSGKTGRSEKTGIRPRAKRRPEIDEMVPYGLPLKEMGRRIGNTKQLIQHYLIETGQHGGWREYRQANRHAEKQGKEFKKQEEYQLKQEESQQLERLTYVLNTRVNNLAREEPFAVQKTIKYIQSLRSAKRAKYRHELLITIFDRYERAMNNGEKLSLEQLGEGLGLLLPSIGKILKRAGLEPLYGARERHTTPYEKKEALKRSHAIDMSASDIAYFLEIPTYVVWQNFRRIGERPKVNNFFLAEFNQKLLSYRLASQIYEANDLGFDKGEVSQLFGTNKEVVNYVIKNRSIGENYQKKIVDVLRVMHGDKTISTPYLEMSKG